MVAVKMSGFRLSPEWRKLSLSCHSGESRNPGVLPPISVHPEMVIFQRNVIPGLTRNPFFSRNSGCRIRSGMTSY